MAPKILGNAVDLHPVAVLVALVFWAGKKLLFCDSNISVVWGAVGAILSVPLMAIMKGKKDFLLINNFQVWCDHVEHPLFRNVGRILGHKNKPLPTVAEAEASQKTRRPSREDLDEVIQEADAKTHANHGNKDVEMEAASSVVTTDPPTTNGLSGVVVQDAPLPAEHPLRDDHVE